MILETFKKFWIIGETVRTPSFVHEVRASEVLKNCFCEMTRCLVTAQSPVRIERRKKGTATTLESILILAADLRLVWPLAIIKGFCVRIGPAVSDDSVLIHLLPDS